MSRSPHLDHTPAPPASRARPPGWRDPRLWAGLAIVAVCVVAGARLFAAADDTVTVWRAAHDLAPGEQLQAEDLEPSRVRFASEADLAGYLSTAAELPASVLSRGLAAGDLVPRSAFDPSGATDTVSVSISVPLPQVPTRVRTGSRVDVYLLPARTGQRGAERILADIMVIDTRVPGGGIGGAGVGRQLVLAVPASEQQVVGRLLTAARDDRVRVTGAA